MSGWGRRPGRPARISTHCARRRTRASIASRQQSGKCTVLATARKGMPATGPSCLSAHGSTSCPARSSARIRARRARTAESAHDAPPPSARAVRCTAVTAWHRIAAAARGHRVPCQARLAASLALVITAVAPVIESDTNLLGASRLGPGRCAACACHTKAP